MGRHPNKHAAMQRTQSRQTQTGVRLPKSKSAALVAGAIFRHALSVSCMQLKFQLRNYPYLRRYQRRHLPEGSTLVSRVPRVGGMPELCTYRCEACGHVETLEAQPTERQPKQQW